MLNEKEIESELILIYNATIKHLRKEIDDTENISSKWIEEALDNLEASEKKYRNPVYHIGIIGEQGTGKTTLVNAMFFNDEVLPVSCNITTNVITEIKKSSFTKLMIRYEDGREEDQPFDMLQQFIDEEFNPANQKKVERAIIEYPLVGFSGDENVCLYDTIGVGALDVENATRTYAFLPILDSVLFMLESNPPLPASSANFINEAKNKGIDNFFFVQNKKDLIEDDIDDAVGYTKGVLDEIKGKLDLDEIRYYSVSALNALAGIVGENQDIVQESNILKLKADLNEFISDKRFYSRTYPFLSSIHRVLGNYYEKNKMIISSIEDYKNDDEIRELYDQLEDYKSYLDTKKNEGNEIVQQVPLTVSSLEKTFNNDLMDAFKKIENELCQLIDNGSVNNNNFNQIAGNVIKGNLEGIEASLKVGVESIILRIGRQIDSFAKEIHEKFPLKRIEFEKSHNLSSGLESEFAGDFLNLGASTIGFATTVITILSFLEIISINIPVWGWIVAGVSALLLLIGGDKLKKKARNDSKSKLHTELEKQKKEIIYQVNNSMNIFSKEFKLYTQNCIMKILIQYNEITDSIEKTIALKESEKKKMLEQAILGNIALSSLIEKSELLKNKLIEYQKAKVSEEVRI